LGNLTIHLVTVMDGEPDYSFSHKVEISR